MRSPSGHMYDRAGGGGGAGMCTFMRVIIYTWHTIYMHGFFQTPARSYLTCLEGLSLCIFKDHIFKQYILINISTSASRSVQPFVVVCMCVCVCLWAKQYV